jgi:hypothetical protein
LQIAGELWIAARSDPQPSSTGSAINNPSIDNQQSVNLQSAICN